MDISTALQRVGEYKQAGSDKWRAPCPAHGGDDKNLEIRNDDGKAYFTCYSHGCDYKDILQALGDEPVRVETRPIYRQPPPPEMPPSHANGNGNGNGKKGAAKKSPLVFVARYDYVDESGEYLFHKERYTQDGKKTFRAREGDAWSLSQTTRRVLYKLPDVISSPVVFVVEGEKDVDRLFSEGLIATCNFDGASMPERIDEATGRVIRAQKPKWLDSYNEFFEGKTVYILPDNDEQGIAHAIYINKALHKIADVKIVEITKGMGKGADVSDWLDDGHTVDELIEIVTAPPSIDTVRGIPRIVKGTDLFAKHFDPFSFILDGMFAMGHLFMLGGRPKSGKSWLMLQMAAAIDQRREFLGMKTKPCRILYIALEDGERRINQRMKILKWTPSKNIDFMFDIKPLSTGTENPGIEQLELLIPFYDLIVIDTLIATLKGGANENDNVQMGAVMNGLSHIAHDNNKAIAIVHHTGKGNQDDPFNGFRGASAIRGAYDIGAILKREVGDGEAMLHLESRDFDIEDMTIRQNKDGAGWESLGGKNVMKIVKAGKRIIEYMEEYGDGFTARDYADQEEITYQAANKALKTAEDNGLIRSELKAPFGGGRKVTTYYEVNNDIPV